jgi:beta-lactam-binding protein with PASTA domain
VFSIRPDEDPPAASSTVPDVTGMTYERANDELASVDLLAYRLDEENAEVAEGNVIRTEPSAGETLTPGDEVRVVVSEGQEMSTVPTLEGLGRDAASDALTDAGLTLGIVTQRNDPELAEGTVISADQPSGAEVAAGTAVNLEVASGRVTIADVTGYTLDAATRELEELALTVIPQEDPDCASGGGDPTVASQSLAPGDVPIRAEITLVYCTGE